jgi:endoglucanase
MLRANSTTVDINFFANPSLKGLSPLECLDAIIYYCGLIGLRVILDRHSSIADNAALETFWYIPGDPYYTEQQIISDWVMLATRYKGSAVIGADLWNEPKILTTWGSGIDSTDWNKAAERIGNAILAVNSQWLLIIEGINYAYDLTGVLTAPIQLTMKNKVVYSVHEYSDDFPENPLFLDPKFPYNLREAWNQNFGYLVTSQIAPVLVGSFGASLTKSTGEVWLQRLLNYTNGEFTSDGVNDLPIGYKGISWCYWGLNPYGSAGGILASNWTTVDYRKINILKSSLAPLMNPPQVVGVDPSSSVGNVTSVK